METQPRQAPKREGCKEAILALLEQHGGEMPVKELEDELREMGYSYRTIQRAKTDYKAEGILKFERTDKKGNWFWMVRSGHFGGQVAKPPLE